MLFSACTDRDLAPEVPAALTIGQNQTIFAVSTRARNPDGSYGSFRATGVGFLELTVSIPPEREPGSLAFGYGDPDPEYEFVIADRTEFPDAASFRKRINGALAALPPEQREISVFVHGYNATQAETAFRAAQIAQDIGVPGVKTIYSWPSRGKGLGYVYDNDSMLFARDGLERLLRALGRTKARRAVVIAHSMGGLLTLEAMRQIEIADPGWTASHIGGVVLIAPDIDVDVFHAQAARMAALPQPFIVFVSGRDAALSLSALVRGESRRDRLGSIDTADAVSDLPIRIIDTTAFSGEAESSHLVAVTSPTMVSLLREAASASRTFGTEQTDVIDTLAGQTVWRGNGRAIYTRLGAPAEQK